VYEQDVVSGALLEGASLTLEELAGACAVNPTWVVSHVEEGLLEAEGDRPEFWRFTSRTLWRARQIRLLERDFEAVPELAALVADLIEEIESMRMQLRRAGLR
jgi:chaperone modulatory protein CbpM